MKTFRNVGDVAELPTVVFGARGILWWGVFGFMAIEGTTLAVCAASYLYVRKNFTDWPPPPTPLPSLLIPTIGVLLMVVSIWPMSRLERAARKFDKDAVQRGLILMSVFGLALSGLRYFEFRSLNTHWDTDAYGSTAWATVAFHSTLLWLEAVETSVIAALFLFGPIEEKHFSDVEDNAVYWYFMTLVWVPLYFLLYISPRIL